MLKALSLGAKACAGGRLYLYALAAAGQAGVERALGQYKAELERDMKLMGCTKISDLNRNNLKLVGSELISILNIDKALNPGDILDMEIKYLSGDIKTIKTLCRIDTKNELEYYKNGGILQYVLRNMV